MNNSDFELLSGYSSIWLNSTHQIDIILINMKNTILSWNLSLIINNVMWEGGYVCL